MEIKGTFLSLYTGNADYSKWAVRLLVFLGTLSYQSYCILSAGGSLTVFFATREEAVFCQGYLLGHNTL
jgi:hypothetical protein